MTIAINTFTGSYIKDLSDFLDEIRDEMDNDGYDERRILRGVGRAEARFNRELRLPAMETNVLLMSVGEYTNLPNDFLQMRLIYQEGSPDSPLCPLSPAQLRKAYQGAAGAPAGYAIEGSSLIIGPVGPTTLNMTYYRRIPALTRENPTSWLLDNHPDLYLHQTLAILFNRIGDTERAGLHLGIANDLIASVQTAGNAAAWGNGPLAPRMNRSVRGVIV